MLDPEKITDLRKRVLNDEPWTEEEMALAIRQMIGERMDQLAAPKAKAKSTKKPSTSLDDLL